MCPIGTVTFRLAAQTPSHHHHVGNFDKILILSTTCHDIHGEPVLSMLVMGVVSGLISTFHCVTRESIPHSTVEVCSLEKQEEQARLWDGALLFWCSSVKSTSRHFLHLFGRTVTTKQTNRLQHLTFLCLCPQFVTFMQLLLEQTSLSLTLINKY